MQDQDNIVNSLAQGKYNRGKSPRVINTYKMELQISNSVRPKYRRKVFVKKKIRR